MAKNFPHKFNLHKLTILLTISADQLKVSAYTGKIVPSELYQQQL